MPCSRSDLHRYSESLTKFFPFRTDRTCLRSSLHGRDGRSCDDEQWNSTKLQRCLPDVRFSRSLVSDQESFPFFFPNVRLDQDYVSEEVGTSIASGTRDEDVITCLPGAPWSALFQRASLFYQRRRTLFQNSFLDHYLRRIPSLMFSESSCELSPSVSFPEDRKRRQRELEDFGTNVPICWRRLIRIVEETNNVGLSFVRMISSRSVCSL